MAVEKINKINLFGQEFVLSGSNGTAGGSGGGFGTDWWCIRWT